jgi:nucleotide-binding universal stress UspA family protein
MMKILLAIDGSPCSDAAVEEVCRRPWPTGTEVRLITVDHPIGNDLFSPSSRSAFDEIVAKKREEAARHLNAAAAKLTRLAPSLRVKPLLLEGVPKEVILDEAERWKADLIVVGSQGNGAIKRLFLGSVSLAIASNATCSVEIVRCPAAVSPL